MNKYKKIIKELNKPVDNIIQRKHVTLRIESDGDIWVTCMRDGKEENKEELILTEQLAIALYHGLAEILENTADACAS